MEWNQNAISVLVICGILRGEISDQEFSEIERDVLARIREIKGQRQGAITMSPKDKISGVDIDTFDEPTNP